MSAGCYVYPLIMSDHQTSFRDPASAWMPGNTSRRAGFGTSFARRPAAQNVDQTVVTVSLSAPGTSYDRLSSFGKPLERSESLAPTSRSFNSTSNAALLSNSLPGNSDGGPSSIISPAGRASEQQLMMQLSGNVATCVHQNELIISLLERLVAVKESNAGRRSVAGDSKFIASPSVPPHERHTSGESSSALPAASGFTDAHVLPGLVAKLSTAQHFGTEVVEAETSLDASYNAFDNIVTSSSAISVQDAGSLGGMLSHSGLQQSGTVHNPSGVLHKIMPVGTPSRFESTGLQTFETAMTADEQVYSASVMCYAAMGETPVSHFLIDDGEQRRLSRRFSLRVSAMPPRDRVDVQSDASINSIQPLSDECQQEKKRKRDDAEDAADFDRASRPQAASINLGGKDAVGPWQDWEVQRQHPSSVLERLPRAKHRTLREVRAEIKANSNRPSGAVGRIPLKQYLEVSGPEECRAVRRLGRKLYTAWLKPNTRLGKQDSARLSACINCIEYTFPALADCEEHWKARQVMLQVIDNAIDEHKSSERRKATMSAAGVNAAPARRRGRPKGTTAAAMARRRQEQMLPYACEQDNESNETDADNHSDSSESEAEA